MAVKIKLQRLGKIRTPHYRVIIADARTRRDGKEIEVIGTYSPKNNPSIIDIDSERAQYWIGVGAQPTEPVLALLKVTGDWQKAKGLPGAEGSLEAQPEKKSKLDIFNEALSEANNGPSIEAITEKKKKAKEEAEAKAAAEKEAEEKTAAEAAAAEESADDSAEGEASEESSSDSE